MINNVFFILALKVILLDQLQGIICSVKGSCCGARARSLPGRHIRPLLLCINQSLDIVLLRRTPASRWRMRASMLLIQQCNPYNGYSHLSLVRLFDHSIAVEWERSRTRDCLKGPCVVPDGGMHCL